MQGPPQPDIPLIPAPTHPNPSARTWFGPDFDLLRKRVISGRNRVEIRSKSGPSQVRAEGFSWVGAGGVGPGGRVPVAPWKVSTR